MCKTLKQHDVSLHEHTVELQFTRTAGSRSYRTAAGPDAEEVGKEPFAL